MRFLSIDFNFISLFFLAVIVSGCGGGGGGGGGSSSGAPVQNTSPTNYSIQGTVSGLTGTIELQNNGADTLTISANGNFSFSQRLEPEDTFNVEILEYPANQYCFITNSSGTVYDSNITDLGVVCAEELALVSRIGNGLSQGIDNRFNYSYVAASGGLQIFETSNPNDPVALSFIDLSGWVTDVEVLGDYAYVANEEGLVCIDISDPAAPVILGKYDTEQESYSVAVDGYYAYLTRLGHGMDIIDVSNPESPSLVSSVDGINYPRDIKYSDESIYLADAVAGLVIIDVSNRSAPVISSSFDEVGSANAVDVRDSIAYVISSVYDVAIIDVGNRSSPSLLSSYPLGDTPRSLRIILQSLYIGGDYTFQVIDVENPSDPQPDIYLTGIRGPILDVDVSGAYAHLVGPFGLEIVSTFQSFGGPTSVATHNSLGDPRGSFPSNNYLYLAQGKSGVTTLDVSAPESPVISSNVDIPLDTEATFSLGSNLYTAGDYFSIFDVTDPTLPVELGQFRFNEAMLVKDLQVVNNYAYVLSTYQGVIIIDVSDPSTPVEVARVDRSGAGGMAINQNHIYIASGQGVTVVNISNPEMPVEEEEFELFSSLDIAVSGTFLYVSRSNGELTVLDASTPESIEVVDQLTTPVWPTDIAIQDNHLYVGYEYDGVVVMSIEDKQNPTMVAISPPPIGRLNRLSVDSNFVYVSEFGGGVSIYDTLD